MSSKKKTARKPKSVARRTRKPKHPIIIFVTGISVWEWSVATAHWTCTESNCLNGEPNPPAQPGTEDGQIAIADCVPDVTTAGGCLYGYDEATNQMKLEASNCAGGGNCPLPPPVPEYKWHKLWIPCQQGPAEP